MLVPLFAKRDILAEYSHVSILGFVSWMLFQLRQVFSAPSPVHVNSYRTCPSVPRFLLCFLIFFGAEDGAATTPVSWLALALFPKNRDAFVRYHHSCRVLDLRFARSFMLALRRWQLFVCALLTLAAIAPAFADDISKIVPKGYVTDLAGVIPADTRQRLEALCAELEQKTGAQLAIVTVRSLDDRPVEDYAVDLFKHLGVGAQKQASGVLLLVAPNDRKYRIEVGYGLEPIITDARAGDAGRAMVPLLRQNDFGSAIEVAAWQLAKYVADDKGITLSGTPPRRPASRSRPSGGFPISPWVAFVILFVIFQIFSSVARSVSGGRRSRSGGMGGCWWILPFLGGGGGSGWGGGYRGGGSTWGGGGGSWGGSGDTGFGGFGGGSSGGGGASGSW
jgi:uncharacterized protein